MSIEGVWRGIQLVLNPLSPLPVREAVLQSLVSGVLSVACSNPHNESDVKVFKDIISGLCNVKASYTDMCKSMREKIAEIERSAKANICTIARELLGMYSGAAPRIRLMQQSLVVLALIGLLYKLEKFSPLERFEHFIPMEIEERA